MFSPSAVIKEKTLAAKRAGVKDIILPEDNRQNLQENLTPERLGFAPIRRNSGSAETSLPTTTSTLTFRQDRFPRMALRQV